MFASANQIWELRIQALSTTNEFLSLYKYWPKLYIMLEHWLLQIILWYEKMIASCLAQLLILFRTLLWIYESFVPVDAQVFTYFSALASWWLQHNHRNKVRESKWSLVEGGSPHILQYRDFVTRSEMFLGICTLSTSFFCLYHWIWSHIFLPRV